MNKFKLLSVFTFTVAMLSIFACSNMLQDSQSTGSDGTAVSIPGISKSVVAPTQYTQSQIVDWKLNNTLVHFYPALGSQPPLLKELKVDGSAIAVDTTYGPLKITKLYYSSTNSSDIIGFDFTSEMPVAGFFVKGGNGGGYLFDYTGQTSLGDTWLYSPVNSNTNPKTGKITTTEAAISHFIIVWGPEREGSPR